MTRTLLKAYLALAVAVLCLACSDVPHPSSLPPDSGVREDAGPRPCGWAESKRNGRRELLHDCVLSSTGGPVPGTGVRGVRGRAGVWSRRAGMDAVGLRRSLGERHTKEGPLRCGACARMRTVHPWR